VTNLNGDSWADIVALDQYGPAVVFFNGPEAMTPTHELRESARSLAVIADDVTGDGVPDVVIGSSDGVHVIEFDGLGDVMRSFAMSPARYALELTTADLNDDGFRDIAMTDVASARVTVLYGPLSPTPVRRRGVRQ
jgi:hypothetical protein